MSSPDKISVSFFNSSNTYTFKDPILSPFAMGASIGP